MAVRSTKTPGARWTCPECRRQFGRPNQSHGCSPSGTVEDYFADRPPVQRRIYDRIATHLQRLGPVLIDPVGVCVMFKRTRTFAEVRSKKSALVLSVLRSEHVEHPRITKTLKLSANRVAHYVELERPEDVDSDVRAWLTASFLESPP